MKLPTARSTSSVPPHRLPTTPVVQIHTSMAAIVDQYDAFILDQFGVLHNGAAALEGAVDCIQQFASSPYNKKLVILSNTSGPAQVTMNKLPKYGFDSSHFIGAVTSGEESSKYLLQTYGSSTSTAADDPPKRALWFTWDTPTSSSGSLPYPNPMDYLKQCGNILPAASVDEADFILAHGSHVWRRKNQQVEDDSTSSESTVSLGSFFETGRTDEIIDPLLQQCVDRQLPLICANPDYTVRLPDGSTAAMPGTIAKRYAEMIDSAAASTDKASSSSSSSLCRSFGKPDAKHFQACLDLLGIDPNDEDAKRRVVHVGDSLHHDICGANAAGIDSLWITSSGIHCDELYGNQQQEACFGVLPQDEAMVRLLDQEGHYPTHAMAAFRF